jgi:hypothetical protein
MLNQNLVYSAEDQAPYSFDNLIKEFQWLANTLPDSRIGLNKSYSMADAALGAFSIFFMQSPSFLAHQIKMKEVKGYSNAQSLFQIKDIPSDNQIRNLLDNVSPKALAPMFDHVFNGLNSIGYFEHYRAINKTILIALDGVTYFSSKKIHCEQCSTRHHKNNTIDYMHHAITPVIVAPGNSRVISLNPEFITPQDGHDKQDSENAAAKRWLKEHSYKYKTLGVTILGDDLYSHQPLCEIIQQLGLHFILTCKPDSHIKLYEVINNSSCSDKISTFKVQRTEGKRKEKIITDTYRFINNVPIRGSVNALIVNWCELITTNENGEIIFINTYITDHEITLSNVVNIVTSGRARWKIENENNNTLKNHGYNLKHSFGHGKKYLSQQLLTLNLLAFLFHTVLSIMDKKYQILRELLPTRKIFFDHIKALTTYLYFDNWDALLQFMIDGLKNKFLVSSMVPIESTL